MASRIPVNDDLYAEFFAQTETSQTETHPYITFFAHLNLNMKFKKYTFFKIFQEYIFTGEWIYNSLGPHISKSIVYQSVKSI